MKKRKIFKKLFILLPNIQMPTTTNFHNTVDTVDTNKKVTLKSVMTTLALFTTLFGKNVAGVAQSTQETKENVKEIVVSTPVQEENDSTIMYNDAKGLENGEEREITPEEIQEYLESHKEEISNEINKKIQDEKISKIVVKELIENEKIKPIINEMINDKGIRDAAVQGDLQYIKEILQKKMNDELKEVRNRNLFSGFVICGIFFICLFAAGANKPMDVKKDEKNI